MAALILNMGVRLRGLVHATELMDRRKIPSCSQCMLSEPVMLHKVRVYRLVIRHSSFIEKLLI